MPPRIPLALLGAALVGAGVPRDGRNQTAGATFSETIPGTEVTFDMAFAPGGVFAMGSPTHEGGREPDEGPQRTVTLDAFWIGVHELTHDEFAVFRYRRLDSDVTAVDGRRIDVDGVTRPTPPYEDPAHGMGTAGYPAAGMTQWAALEYARWLSRKTERLYRLPTEAEWEYACRAGTTDPHPFGFEAGSLDGYAWHEGNSDGVFQPVGRTQPNPWGIHDLLGNVAEWTMDEYGAEFYAGLSDSSHAPWSRPTSVHPRTVRGGSFRDAPADLRCANRLRSTLRWKRRDPQLPKSPWWNTDSPHVGFRLVTPDRRMSVEEIDAYWADIRRVR